MKVDHIGIVCKSLEQGVKQWEQLFGYHQATHETINSIQKVKVIFMEKPDSIQVKLLEPVDEKSPIFNFAQRGGGLHHICIKVTQIDNAIESLKSSDSKVHLLVKPQPGEAFNNNMIAFLMGENNLNFELIDTEERANRIK